MMRFVQKLAQNALFYPRFFKKQALHFAFSKNKRQISKNPFYTGF